MKNVVLNLLKDVYVDSVTENFYYGCFITDCNKSFIIQDNYRSGSFSVVCINGMTYKNGFGYDGNTLKECIKNVLNSGNNRVFEFQTPQELFAWLVA